MPDRPKKLEPPVDEEEYRVLNFGGMSDYDRNKSVNIPDAFSLTPKGDGFDAFWFRSRYSYIGDFTGIAVNQEVIVYWGEDPSVHPELTRVQLSLDSFSTLLSTAPDISNDAIYTMALGTNSSATVDSIEFIAKELGYKNLKNVMLVPVLIIVFVVETLISTSPV